MEKVDLMGFTIEELKAFAAEAGEKPFRGKQLFKWINRGVTDFDDMTDFSLVFRQRLDEIAYVGGAKAVASQQDKSDGTVKFLFELTDGALVEGVLMKYKYGNSFCVSSQVGCKMGCRFCASAIGGFVRNLTAGEMLSQILEAERASGESVNHIVVMGMGEPFDNYDNLKKFLMLLHHSEGRNMSYRNMTVSTSGLIPMMKIFAEDFRQVNLAISLHSLDEDERSRIMPVNRKYPLKELIAAAKEHSERTGRRITFEYALIQGKNDRNEDVELMKKRLSGINCHVNLIPLNDVEGTGLRGSGRKRAAEIAAILNNAGIAATVRRELGGEIEGACGQLRLKKSLP